MISGRMAATEEAMMRAFGSTPSASAFSSDITSTAAAPSLSGHELPAVTVPFSGSKAGLSSASFSSVVPGRGPSSRVTSPTATISASKWPLSRAATARSCDVLAHSSCASRETWQRLATFSAVSPIGM